MNKTMRINVNRVFRGLVGEECFIPVVYATARTYNLNWINKLITDFGLPSDIYLQISREKDKFWQKLIWDICMKPRENSFRACRTFHKVHSLN